MPSLNDVISGSSADSSCVQQIIDAWKGTAGLGVPASLTAVSDAANWALDVKNNEAVNSRTFRASRANGTVLIQADVNGVQVSSTGGAPATVVNTSDTQTLTGKTFSSTAGSGNNLVLPHCRVFNTSSQTINTGAHTAVTFNSERWDNDNLHSTAVNPARITPSRAGLWRFGGQMQLDANSSGAVAVELRLNGATFIAIAQVPNNAVVGIIQHITTEYECSTTDYCELLVFQNSGGNLGTTPPGGNFVPEFWASYVGTT